MAKRNEITEKEADVRERERQGGKNTLTRQDFLKASAGFLTVSFMSGTAMAQINRLPPGTPKSMGHKLRAMLERKGQPVFVAHAIDALSAKLMYESGYEASFIGTSGVQGRWTNYADRGLTDVTESIRICKYMTEAVPDYPLILDGDTGHGGPDMVRHLIQECIKIGLAGIRIDDQEIEKKRTTGNSGITVADREVAIARYKAASDARNELEPAFVIEAQMYTREAVNGGLQEAMTRIPLYEKHVDWVNVTRAQSLDEMKQARKISKKFLGGMNGQWAKGFTTVKQYGDVGLNSIWGEGPGGEADAAVNAALAEFKKRGADYIIESQQGATRADD